MKVNARGSLPAATMQAYQKAQGSPVRDARPPAASTSAPAGPESTRLAAGLRAFLDAVDAEVRAVSSLAERIDAAVSDLNELRDEQGKRLLVLDELQAAADDVSLAAFLNKTIKPRTTRVSEIVPERLK